VRKRHPWVFDGSIKQQNREGRTGEMAVIYDKQDKFLAIGLYDPHSPIRIRVLHAGKPAQIDTHWWQQKLQAAILKRKEVLALDTTGIRWIYGENDGWPGLVLDGYGKTLVIKLYTSAWFPYLKEQISLFQNQFQSDRIVLRLSRNIQSLPAPERKWVDGAILTGSRLKDSVVFAERGITMRADVVRGQKTGFFQDQRDNRAQIGSLARGKTVLNLFSFSGGFSLHAAQAGALSVTNVDISSHALVECQANWELNANHPGFRHCKLINIQADVFQWLEQQRDTYDIVIIDPPSLAKCKADRKEALKAYRKLAQEGQRLTRAGGTLLCCSCSAHVTKDDFLGTIQEAVKPPFRIDRLTGHAPDHPTGMAELDYLKAVYISSA